MSAESKIQWSDRTWNPTVGCTRVSAGCDKCYAFELHDKRHVAWKRGRWESAPEQYHQPFSRVQLIEERLTEPLRWRKPSRVFVNSMSDLFHEDVPDAFIDRVFAVMALAPQHTFQVLTKRPERMRAYLTARGRPVAMESAVEKLCGDLEGARGWKERFDHWLALFSSDAPNAYWPLPNVWIGVSVEDQRAANARIPELLATPAAVRFLSCEPLLGPVDLRDWRWHGDVTVHDEPEWDGDIVETRSSLGWVIAGGESGPHARPCDVAWLRSLVAQCRAAAVPVFVEQLGSRAVMSKVEAQGGWTSQQFGDGGGRYETRYRHPHGGDPAEWPEDLRVREFPG